MHKIWIASAGLKLLTIINLIVRNLLQAKTTQFFIVLCNVSSSARLSKRRSTTEEIQYVGVSSTINIADGGKHGQNARRVAEIIKIHINRSDKLQIELKSRSGSI